jgi:hypothetical protein
MPRRRHEIEGGRREVVLLPGHGDLVLARGVGRDLHRAVREARIEMAAERVARLVIVVVGVEDPESDSGHREVLPRCGLEDSMVPYYSRTREQAP